MTDHMNTTTTDTDTDTETESSDRRIAIEELTDDQIERGLRFVLNVSREFDLYKAEEWLTDLYYTAGMTLNGMGAVADCHQQTIANWMDEYGLDRRTGNRFERKPWASYGHHARGYPKWDVWNSDEETQHTVLVHRLIAAAEYGLAEMDGKIVHHINGVKWDNRPSNLELMTQSEHATQHGKQQAKRQGWHK